MSIVNNKPLFLIGISALFIFAVGKAQEVPAVIRLREKLAPRDELIAVDEALDVGDLFEAGDLETLPVLQSAHELRGLQQAVMRAGVEPGVAAAHALHVELAGLEIRLVDGGDLEFSAGGGLHVGGDVEDGIVVEVEAGDGPGGIRGLRLLDDLRGPADLVEADDAVGLGILDMVGEHRRAVRPCGGAGEQVAHAGAEKEVVAEDQRDRIVADELARQTQKS